MKVFGLAVIQSLQEGFLTTARHDNSELYQKAQAALLPNLLLNSTVVDMDRDDHILIEVSTPIGHKLIRSKRLLITIPPLANNLRSFDLSDMERDLFSQFNYVGYWTALTRNDGLSDDLTIDNIGVGTPDNLPVLPGMFSINPTGVPGLHAVKYGAPSPVTITEVEVKQGILDSIGRLATGGADPGARGNADFAVFSSHTPYALTVSAGAIRDGFYEKLYALQGERNTWYTGAAFNAHDSSMLWVFTEEILPSLAA
jgi:hypothetical protein